VRALATAVGVFALVVLVGCGAHHRAEIVRVATFPVPSGPGRLVSAVALSALPRPLPPNPAQPCRFGPTVRLTLRGGRVVTYGPCRLPAGISRLRNALLRAAGQHPPGGRVSAREWKSVLNDWYDGAMDQWHRCAAVREATRHLPEDQPVFSTVRTDLESYERAVC
jgi:hypothetical protein